MIRFLLVVLLLLPVLYLAAEEQALDLDFEDNGRFNSYINLRFSGVPEIRNNTINYYRLPKGLSIYRKNAFFTPELRPETIIELDPDNLKVILKTKVGTKFELYHPIELSLNDYLNNLFRAQFKEQLNLAMQSLLDDEKRDTEVGLIPELVLDLPPLPRTLRRFIGDRPTRLSLTGSQKLTISGSSTKRDDRRLTEQGTGASFSLDMRQELNLMLRGTIGDKIHVNVRHNSESDLAFGDPSMIEIEYKGDEDEIVQSIKGGNISLALRGSQFISYSASSAGLFGVRGDFKLGDLSITAIASKEESERLSRRFTGTDAADSLQYRSSGFVNRTHYYVTNPYDLYELYTEDENPLPGYANNAIKTANNGTWLIGNPGLLPDRDEPFRVYLDTGQVDYTENTIDGWEIGEDPEQFQPYNFLFLEINSDYFIDFDTGILTMNRSVDRRHTIGIVYTQRNGLMVGNPDETDLRVKVIRRGNQSAQDEDTWPLQVRNLYNLNRRNIQNEGFRLNFFTVNADGSLNYYADDEVIPGGMEINEYLRLDTNGDGVINGYDETVNLTTGFVILPFIEPFKAFSDAIIYEHENFSSSDLEQIRIYLSAVGKIGRDKIELGQMNLLPGSVRVIVDGETLQENVHYLVDYDFGHITFLTERGRNPDSNIEVNYEYRPLFAVESKTLAGVRADWNFSDGAVLGGTFIYHSEKVTDRRPRIGNENKTLLMANIDGRLEFDPPLLTKMVDLIPLIRTDTDSRVRLSGEVAMTVPRIYGHKDQPNIKEAYLDDMEMIVDTYPLGLTRLGWSPASKPVNVGMLRARPNWYNPDNIYAEQVYSPEFLTQKERRERVQVLTLRSVPTDISNPNITNQHWSGIMRYLGNELDFSEKKYIEVLVRVDQYPFQDEKPTVTMHIDLGDISEDFYVWNGGKGVLNTEDGANGGMRDGILEPREDVGLDGIPEGEPGDDPWDFFSNERDQYGDYPFINGTSGNGILDSEDLNNNGVLDTLNRYFQYSINLNSLNYESEYNGWRLYRIPIDDYVVKSEVTSRPDLRRINFARVWLETEELTRVHIAQMNLIGTKWQEGFIKDIDGRVLSPTELQNFDESMSVGVVDNQNNRDHYVSPPGVTAIEDGIPLMEQSLTIDYRNLQQDHKGMAVQRFREAQNLLTYGKLRYYFYLERERNDEIPIPKGSQEIIFRVGADSLNYYEVRYPAEAFSYNADGNRMLANNWREIEIDFSELTSLKQFVESATDTYEKAIPITIGGEPDSLYLKVKGNRVTLTNIREMSVGVVNRGTRTFTGRVYVNDIRVADPYEDVGFAARTTLNTTFADFSTLNVGLVWRSENFNTATQRTRTPRTTNEESISLDITNRYNLHKFFPANWGLNIPLTLIRNQSTGTPRYKANSDILREDIIDPFELEREKRESMTQSAELSFSQSVTPRNRLLQYTIRNTSVRANIRQNMNRTATSADTTLIYSGNVAYNLTLPREKLGFNLSNNYRIFFFPQTFNNTVDYRAEEPNRWRWDTNLADSLATKWTPERYAQDRKDLTLTTNVAYDMSTDLRSTYSFSHKRDLTKEGMLWDYIPWGRESSRDQNITLNYSPNYLQRWFNFNFQGSVRYNENQKPVQQRPGQTDVDEFDYEIDGSVNRSGRFNVTLKNRDLLTGLMQRHGIRYRELPQTSPDDYMSDFDTPRDWDDSAYPGFEDFESDVPDWEPPTQDQQREEEERRREEEEKQRREAEERQVPSRPDRPPDAKPGQVQEQKLWARALTLISRFDNFNVTYENNHSSRFTRWDERPDFLYQVGMPDQIDNEREELDMKNDRNYYSVSTGYPILVNLATTLNYSHTVDRRYSSASQKEVTTVFPNVRLTLTGFERLIRAERFLSSSRLSSSYTFTETTRGAIDWDKPDWDKPTFRQKTYSFSPLISWHANWANNVTSSVSYNRSESQSINFRETFEAVQTTNTQSINTSLSYSFRSPQGIKLPFMANPIPVTNEMTTEVSGNWEQSKSSNRGAQETIVDRDTEKYSVSPRISYNFSRNIKGGLQSNYENTRDKRREESLRVFSLSIWVEIIF